MKLGTQSWASVSCLSFILQRLLDDFHCLGIEYASLSKIMRLDRTLNMQTQS